MRLVTTFDLSRPGASRFGVSASSIAWNSERSLMRCAPQSDGELRRGDAPHLLVVRLEEVLVEPPTEPRRDEPFEGVWFFGWWTRTQRYDATQRTASTGPRLRSTFIGDERVVVELALVEDAALPRPAEEVLLAEDLPPEVVDRADLGEEAVAADVEAPAVALDGATDPADHVVGFEDGDGLRRDPPSSSRRPRSDPPGPRR